MKIILGGDFSLIFDIKLESDRGKPTLKHRNFTPPKVLTWTTSPKGGKDWVLVSCLL